MLSREFDVEGVRQYLSHIARQHGAFITRRRATKYQIMTTLDKISWTSKQAVEAQPIKRIAHGIALIHVWPAKTAPQQPVVLSTATKSRHLSGWQARVQWGKTDTRIVKRPAPCI